MTEPTPLDPTPFDLAHAAMEAAPDDAGARLRFYAALADSELILLLQAEPEGDAPIAPALYDLDGGRYVLAFDSEDRLAAFAGAAVPYAALPGRVIAAQLAGQGIGIGLNLGVAPSAFLMPAEATDWLTATLAQSRPAGIVDASVPEPAAPGLPEALIASLADKITRLAGHADRALILAAGEGRHLLAFVAVRPGAEEALAKAVAEARAFSGVEAPLDVAFLQPDDRRLPRLEAVARVIPVPRLPQPDLHEVPGAAPGMDPDRPPKLR